MTDPNFAIVAEVGRALQFGLHDIARKVRELLTSEAWRKFTDPTGKVQTYDDFAEFVAAPASRGLNSDVKTLQKVCHDQPEVLDLIDQAVQRPVGVHAAIDNINGTTAPSGTSQQQALRRLRKDRPDLHALVLEEELSAHAAMVEAGFRKRTVTLPADPDELACALVRRFSPQDLQTLLNRLLAEVQK